MTVDEAVKAVVLDTGWNPISAFEYDDTIYVSITPLKDYDPQKDMAACFVPVKNGVIGESFGFGDMFLDPSKPKEFFDAMDSAKSYLDKLL